MSHNNMNEKLVNQAAMIAARLEKQKAIILDRYGVKEPKRG